MNIIKIGSHVGSFTAKNGPGGKRNRAARRRLARVTAYHATRNQVVSQVPSLTDDICNVVVEETLDMSGAWDESIARKALELFAKSGQSQRAFAAEHSFPESRIRSWKKKLEQSQAA